VAPARFVVIIIDRRWCIAVRDRGKDDFLFLFGFLGWVTAAAAVGLGMGLLAAANADPSFAQQHIIAKAANKRALLPTRVVVVVFVAVVHIMTSFGTG
jgi:hypothetical protein